MNLKISSIILSLFLCTILPLETLAEGATIKQVEKSLGIKSNKKKRSDIDRLYQDLNEDLKKTPETQASGEAVNQDIVESIGRGNLRSMPYAKLIITNKITTKRQVQVFKVGDVKFFGNLSIEVNKCINDPDLMKPNNMMLLTIFDNKIDDDKLSVFHGWMISNNLSLSTLEHPVYEVIPVECLAEKPKEETTK